MTGWQAASLQHLSVALRKESVDRNEITALCKTVPRVALRKESVDRNYIIKITEITPTGRSP